MWLRIKMVFSPYVLNMRIAVFAFLREIMSPFDVKDAIKYPHWWVRVLLCCKSTNALWYLNSSLFRSGALYMHSFSSSFNSQCSHGDFTPGGQCYKYSVACVATRHHWSSEEMSHYNNAPTFCCWSVRWYLILPTLSANVAQKHNSPMVSNEKMCTCGHHVLCT